MRKAPSSRFKKVFSQRLRAYRMLGGYETAREFAKVINEMENTYTSWERGEALPGIEQTVRICWRLNITPNELIWPKLRHGQEITDDAILEIGVE